MMSRKLPDILAVMTAVTALGVGAMVATPAAHADNRRLNDGVVANVYTVQQQAGCTNDLKINPQLRLAAQWHTNDVLNNRDRDGDIGSDGSTSQDRANAAGFHGRVAETVAINPALAISGIELVNQWYYNPAYHRGVVGKRPRPHGRGGCLRTALTMKYRGPLVVSMMAMAAAFGSLTVATGSAHADEVAYLVNVTARLGHNFANADAAIAHGRGTCDNISQGRGFGQLVDDVKADFHTADNYRGSYLISQPAQELCPNRIWQLRNSAADYRPVVG
jgi:hypothetical protein